MPSHWGHRALNIPSQSSCTGTQCLHAVGCAEAGVIYERVDGIPDREARYHADEVTYVSIGDGATSEGEFWESLNTACTQQAAGAVSSSRTTATPSRSRSKCRRPAATSRALVEGIPRPARVPLRRHRLPGQLPDAARRGRARPRAARARRSSTRRVIRPYSHSLSDDEKLYKTPAEREAEARRDPLLRMRQFLNAEGLATDEELADLLSVGRARGQRRRPTRRSRRRSRTRRRPRSTSSRRTSTRRRRRFATEPQRRRRARHDGGGDQRDAARTRWRATRASSCSARTSPTPAAKRRWRTVAGKGGVFKVTHGLQRQLRQRPRLQLAAGRGQHHRPRRRHGAARAEAGRRDPVLRLHLAGVHADPRRDVDDALPVEQPLVVPDGDPRADRRLPARAARRTTASRASRSSRTRRASASSFPSNAQDAAGLLRTAIRCDDPVLFCEHKHLYRQTYNKGAVPGPGLHGAVRQGVGRPRRHATSWSSPGARWCSARCSRRSRRSATASASPSSTCARSSRTTGTRSPPTRSRTSRVVVAHEDQLTCGFGAEIAARISEELFDYLDAPVKRVAALDCPVAYAPVLEEAHPAGLRRRPQGHPHARRVLGGSARLRLLGTALSRSCRRGALDALRVEILPLDRRPAAAHRRHVRGAARFQQAPTGTVLRVRSARARGLYGGCRPDGVAEAGRDRPGAGTDHPADRLRHRRRTAASSSPTCRGRSSACRCSARPARGSAGFFLPGAAGGADRLSATLVLNGVGSVQYAGDVAAHQPSRKRRAVHRVLAGRLRAAQHRPAADDRLRAGPRPAPGDERRPAAAPIRPAASTTCSSPAADVPQVRRRRHALFERYIQGARARRATWRRSRRAGRGAGSRIAKCRSSRRSSARRRSIGAASSGSRWRCRTPTSTTRRATRCAPCSSQAAGILSPTSLFFTRERPAAGHAGLLRVRSGESDSHEVWSVAARC